MFRLDTLDTAGRVLRYSTIMVSYVNTASTRSITSTEGPNTASAGNMMKSMQNPEYTSTAAPAVQTSEILCSNQSI